MSDRRVHRSMCCLALLCLILCPRGDAWAVGEGVGSFPTYAEQTVHYFANRARVDPVQDRKGNYKPAKPLRYVYRANLAARFQAQHINSWSCWCSDHSNCCTLQKVGNQVKCGAGAPGKCGQSSFQGRMRLYGLSGGENAANGTRSPEHSHQAWVRSTGHWNNMIRSSFTGLGVGRDGNKWVQVFTKGKVPAGPPLYSGSHFPDSTTPTLGIVFYSDVESVQSAKVVTASGCLTLKRVRGSAKHGAYEVKGAFSKACEGYYFLFTTSGGKTYAYPTSGALTVGSGQGCGFWSPTRPKAPAACRQAPTGCLDGAQRYCFGGPAAQIALGSCKVGIQTCASGKWGPCTGQVLPKTETCGDGLDEDCDGLIDEGCSSCKDGSTNPCYTGDKATRGVGACTIGIQTCTSGKWGPCTGETKPAKEICANRRDDDCDGAIDEGCPSTRSCRGNSTASCYEGGTNTNGIGPCKGGQMSCQSDGKYGPCKGQVLPQKEVCGDGIDNDCDGQSDEGCPCKDGQTKACYTGPGRTRGVGTCKDGVARCVKGQWGPCVGQVTPATEFCIDGLDNDCNGQTDNGCPSCKEGHKAPCFYGAANTRGVGECKVGTQTCKAGRYGSCQGYGRPTKERCDDGKDNDCDGVIDNGCPCKDGSQRECYGGPTPTKGVGPCKAGQMSCQGGVWGPCKGQVLPQKEVCGDGIDNDCSGKADDSCDPPPREPPTPRPEPGDEPPARAEATPREASSEAPSPGAEPASPGAEPAAPDASSPEVPVTGEAQAPASDKSAPPSGCGCQTPPHPQLLLALLLLGLFARRWRLYTP